MSATASHPAASVVIPAYNAERWIAATLDSWAAQTDRDFEVIVVDDGSKDATADIAQSYQDRLDIRVLREPPRGAPAGPSNVGTRAARGELILPCDADDMATPDRVSQVRAAWENAGRQDCLIFTDFAEVDAIGATLAESSLTKHASMTGVAHQPVGADLSLLTKQSAFAALLSSGCFIRPCAVAFPRRVFDAIGGYDERLRNGQDYDLFVRIAWEYPFVWLNRKLALYRIAAGNISSRPASAVVPSRLVVLQRLLDLPLTPRQITDVRATMARNYEALAYDQGRRGQTLKSLSAYSQAFRHDPRARHLRGMAAALIKGFIGGPAGQTRSPG